MTGTAEDKTLDLTPKESAGGFALFQCCLPKAEETKVKEEPYVTSRALDSIPDIATEKETKKEEPKDLVVANPPVQENLIMFWKLLLSLLFLNFKATTQKSIEAAPQPTEKEESPTTTAAGDDELEIPDMTE